ncbi:DUF4037 domain-containing protein [Sedimentibacter sp.]|uniref:DUF4037 domain-containing protein n=1 Tax=Sedimentibacter sp. TaxID=1960295 RepID=UPI0028AC5864|nr:DUF4037 domain-containing protein [Sedimentibacter sp.]
MIDNTEKILNSLIKNISILNEIQSIGISGSKTSLPKAGEGDIDIFIYCDKIPGTDSRQAILNQLGNNIEDGKVNIFAGGNWGVGDFLLINGVETWLMYFTVSETLANVESTLKGDLPDKLDNYYYPIGRNAMLKNITILYDKTNFLKSIKERLTDYPDELSNIITKRNIVELDDTEDLERAVNRKDVLFYHFALDIGIDNFLQALFALNKTYFPSRKRTVDFIENFNTKPENCIERLLKVIKLGGFPEGLDESYKMWRDLCDELKNLTN